MAYVTHFVPWKEFKEKTQEKVLQALTEIPQNGGWKKAGFGSDQVLWSPGKKGVTFYYREDAA